MTSTPTTRVIALLSKHVRGVGNITSETRLVEDLGMAGTDAERFILDFSREFGVSLDHFNFDRYFPAEPHAFVLFVGLGHLIRKLFKKTTDVHEDVVLRVADLVAVVEGRRWP